MDTNEWWDPGTAKNIQNPGHDCDTAYLPRPLLWLYFAPLKKNCNSEINNMLNIYIFILLYEWTVFLKYITENINKYEKIDGI